MRFKRVRGAEKTDLWDAKGRGDVHHCGIGRHGQCAARCNCREQRQIQLSGKRHQRQRQRAAPEHCQGRLNRAQMGLIVQIRASGENAGQSVVVLQVEDHLGPPLWKPVFFQCCSAGMH